MDSIENRRSLRQPAQTLLAPLNLADNERESQRTEEYSVKFQDEKGKTYSIQLDQRDWRRYKPGQTYQLKVNALGQAEIHDETSTQSN